VGLGSGIVIATMAYIVVEGDLLQSFLTIFRGCGFFVLFPQL